MLPADLNHIGLASSREYQDIRKHPLRADDGKMEGSILSKAASSPSNHGAARKELHSSCSGANQTGRPQGQT